MKKDVLLFDLGGVIVPWVGHDYLIERFDLSREDVIDRLSDSEIFNAYERGECSDVIFCQEMVSLFDFAISAEEFAELWTSWVLPPYPKTLETLAKLKPHYTLACLSNTNALHWAHLDDMLSLEDVFEYRFASQLMGVAKPDPLSFQIPLQEMNVLADQVIYFDDTIVNVKAARKAGIEAHHVDREKGVIPVLKSLKLV